MIKKRIWKALSLLIAFLLILGVTTVGLADAGGFSGNSDYGGGSWDSGSDWSSDWDFDGGSGVYYGGGGGSAGGGIGGCGTVVIIVVVVIIVLNAKNKNNRGGHGGGSTGGGSISGGAPMGGAPTNKSTVDPTELKRKDPNFSTQEFLEKVSNNYVQMQNCWQDKKWEPMRPLMTDALFSQFERQLNALIARGQTNFVDRIAVLGCRIVGYAQDNVNDSLIVELRTRIVDYTVEDATGTLVSGSKTAEKFMTYEWTLIRSKDRVTPDKEAMKEVHCPNCGAAIAINHSGQCEYCGQVITLNDYDWVISAIRGISQVTR